MTPWLQDSDLRLYHGDVLEVLRELENESVDCVVTSPPYWGLRDYGTGEWEGGDAGCDHKVEGKMRKFTNGRGEGIDDEYAGTNLTSWTYREQTPRETCPKCGATRIDQQLGLEPTPELFVEKMVEVFREVRRVLAAHGTVWLNLGDSYAGTPSGFAGTERNAFGHDSSHRGEREMGRRKIDGPGLKPKDLVGIPWRVAFALQADGWYLRSDTIWSKPNPMPESATDRPTKAHEYVFLLAKQPRYFFDQEAVREAYHPDGRQKTWISGASQNGERAHENYANREGHDRWPGTGRNIRSVWEIATQPYPEAHFATFPEELARRCIAAGCPEQVCRVCGKARERVVDIRQVPDNGGGSVANRQFAADPRDSGKVRGWGEQRTRREVDTIGFTDCGHADYRPGIVLDPFMGSGTVAFVARKLGRHSVGIDLSEEYLELAARRTQQLGLLV